MTVPYAAPSGTTRLSAKAAAVMRAAIRLAGGREVCFAGTLDETGIVVQARTVARGDARSVLALPGFAEQGEILLHNHPSGLLEPSRADMEVAANLYEQGIGFGIVDNDVTDLYVVVEVPAPIVHEPLDPADLSEDLGPDGAVARRLTRYEDRPAQRDMAAAIAELYNDGGVGLIEAGTGVGKSLGYLLPALRWAARNKERTVVSTNTINLQEQLVGKDLPFLARALDDQKVRFALLKGWRNYLCLQRLEQARSGGQSLLEPGLVDEIAALAEWSESTRDGSLADLPVPPRPDVWDEVSAEPDLCPRLKCPHYERCFLFRARREAAQADVIVVNHHLLMSDVAVRRSAQNWTDAAVLPAYQRLVVDEGHHLEDAAGAHLGISVTKRALQRMFARLERRGRGILPALVEKLQRRNDLLSVASLDLVEARLAPAVQAGRQQAELVFDLLDTFLQERGQPVVRLGEEFARDPIWKGGLDGALGDLLGEIVLLQDGLRMVRERMESDTRRSEELAPVLNELRAVARRLEGAGDGLRLALRPPDDAPESVRWVEVRGRERNVAVVSVPLDLAPILRDDLFARAATTVVTSATLAADGNFSFLVRRLGLDGAESPPVTHLLPSPFDYPRQALLGIPSDVPAPNENASGHQEAVVRMVLDLAGAADGGMFVLFTSHRDVRAVATELRARGLERTWPLLVHGEDARDALVRRFRESGRGVLLGTASFWEGVDVPGDALRALVISRLPFRVPTDPMTAAQCEAIERRGGDSFSEYMLPHASLRLKQGFGRLVRTAHDRGVVVIADPRVVKKNYGRKLLSGLPPARRLVAPWAEIRREAIGFFSDSGTEVEGRGSRD
jgi:ATP-dependent DNA helicase DinG